MSNIDKRGLREAAEKATKGRWAVEFDDEIYSTDGVNHEQIAMVFSENEARDAAFIAAANPATVLVLLDELEAAEKRIAELEARSFNPAILDVVAERQRQQSVEGWTPEHDNAYQNSELADAAACYAIHAHNQGFSTPAHWPWSPDWWKQSGARCWQTA